jgi:hypothetical protein
LTNPCPYRRVSYPGGIIAEVLYAKPCKSLRVFLDIYGIGRKLCNRYYSLRNEVLCRLGAETEIQRQSKEQADIIMQNLSALAQNTAVCKSP